MAPGIAEKKNNSLPLWGNEKTMNLNNLILTNILSSHYFKVNLYQLKTYHEVIDEIYFNVNHLEPWEKGSRKTSGQTGMCGGVRGVGAGGIVSTAFCILYKLFTLKLTRKQVVGLITHCDSPFIRALGFMYVRYTQPPGDLWDWFEPYLDDEEELDVKAGGGQVMTIGEMLRHFLTKLEWFSTLFPRIPLPIQKDIDTKLSTRNPAPKAGGAAATAIQNEEKARWPEDSAEEHTNFPNANDDLEWDERDRRSPSPDSRRYRSHRERMDVADEIARERDRQRREKERGHSSRRHRSSSSDRHRNHTRHGDHARSRSRSREGRSHRESRHDRYSERDREYRKHRERRHSREKERNKNYDRKERRRSRSHSVERRHKTSEHDR
ncbi:pre-mRNA-splicing factor 38B-like [Centruroides sculpturatus]|uniref:pre-mRNA-splicing factor 38B-like n=1 Tax=Centruroides sculpturatus TaxID=218467 RepID=UPI000C6DC02A|nr:pre-mRNA-splicing factor 38B-like [Centruroides sculpturatus]